MKGGLFRACRNVDLEKGEADVAEGGQKACLSDAADIGFLANGLSCRRIIDALYGQQQGEEDADKSVGIRALLLQLFARQLAYESVQGILVSGLGTLLYGGQLGLGLRKLAAKSQRVLIAGIVSVDGERDSRSQQNYACYEQAIAFLSFDCSGSLFLSLFHVVFHIITPF